MTRIVVVSDTHAPRYWKQMPDAVARQLEDVDLVLHAGDVCTPDVLDQLAEFAPVRAVKGNNDGPDIVAWGAPDTLTFDVEGVRVGMIHDSGQRLGRLRRMQDRFPDCQLVIYGHSHIPLDEEWQGFHCFNPGSPTDKRMQPHRTLGRIEIVDSAIVERRIVTLD